MENSGHRRSKSAPSFEEIRPTEKFRTFSRLSPVNASCGNGSSSAGKFMVERGESSSVRAPESPMAENFGKFMVERGESSSVRAPESPMAENFGKFMVERGESSSVRAPESPMAENFGKFMVERGESSSVRAPESPLAKYLAEKMFKEAEPKSSSPRGMARLMRLEGLTSLWNKKQKAKLQDGHHQNNVSVNIEPDRQPRGCLYNRRMPVKKQQFSEVHDEPEASHFVNHRLSSKWRASSTAATSEVGLTRQKIDTKHLSFGELIDLKAEDSKVLDDPVELQYSKDRLVNYGRESDSMNANQQASSSRSHLERMDGLLLERYGAHASHRISNSQAEEKKKKKKKKDVFPRPIVFPRSELRIIPSSEDCGSSSYPSRYNIPNFRRMKEYSGVGTSTEVSRRSNDSYHAIEPKAISEAARNLAREVTRELEDTREESEGEMYSGSRLFSCRNSPVDDSEWGRHQCPGPLGNERFLETLKITRTFRDSEIDDDARVLRKVIAIPNVETRYNNFTYRDSDARLGTDSRSSILGASSSIPWSSSRLRPLPPSEGRVHRRDTCHDVSDKVNHVMRRDPISRGRSRAVRGYPIHNDFLASQGSTSRSRMPLPFPPIRIMDRGSSLEATFEIRREPRVGDISGQLRAPMPGRDDCSGDTVYDIMVDKQEIATFPSEPSGLHPRHSSEDAESSAADEQENFSDQGLHYGASEEASSSSNQHEAESLFSESCSDAGYASPIPSFGIPYVEDASFISENFARISAEFNELRTKLDMACPSSSAESWEDWYVVDVLIKSNFRDFGFDILLIMWGYPDYPLNPALFHILEKKYGYGSPELRSERLLLFDRINSALSEIFQKHVDLRPWLMPKLGLLSTRVKEPTKDAVEDLISQDSTNLQIIERILLRDMQWADPVEEFASIGKEVEELLLDDIIGEFVCDLLGLMDVVYDIA